MSSVKKLSSSRPYLLRALYEWINDNGLSPHIVIDTNARGVGLPKEHLNKNAVVFNISPESVKSLRITNKVLTCNASFSGVAVDVIVPINAVLQVFAKENGMGMGFVEHIDMTAPLFDEEIEVEHQPLTALSSSKEKVFKKRGHLQLVKSDKSSKEE